MILIVVLDGESQKIVAADLGINPKTLSLWVVRHKAQMSPSDLNQLNETEALRRQVRQFKAELEFKKKQRRTLQGSKRKVRLY